MHEQPRQNSGLGRNRTITTPSIQPLSCVFRLPYVSIHNHFLRRINFENAEAVEVGFTEFFVSKTRDWYRRGIVNIAERWLKTIESDFPYFEEYINFLSESIPNKILFKKHYLWDSNHIIFITNYTRCRVSCCYENTTGCYVLEDLQWVYCTIWPAPAVARAGKASTYSRRIAYIPANSNHINNF